MVLMSQGGWDNEMKYELRILSEVKSDRERQIYGITSMWNINKYRYKWTYKTQIDSET